MQRYPDEISCFLAENVAGKSTAALIKITNAKFGTAFRLSQIRAYKKNHGLKSGIGQGIPKGTPTKKYPDEVRKFIQAHFVGVGHQGMADLLNQNFGSEYTKGQMKAIYGRMKLNSGRTGRFPKGHKPERCAAKGEHLSRETEFGAGHIPHNHRPLGSEVFRRDLRRASDSGYLYVKIAEPNIWVPKHRLLWEEVNGKIPRGSCLLFADGNRMNISLDNLILISRSQLAVLNKLDLIQNDRSLTETGITIANIHMKMHQRKTAKNEGGTP